MRHSRKNVRCRKEPTLFLSRSDITNPIGTADKSGIREVVWYVFTALTDKLKLRVDWLALVDLVLQSWCAVETRFVRCVLRSYSSKTFAICASIEVKRKPLRKHRRRHSKPARDSSCMASLWEVQGVQVLHVYIGIETLESSDHLILLGFRKRICSKQLCNKRLLIGIHQKNAKSILNYNQKQNQLLNGKHLLL